MQLDKLRFEHVPFEFRYSKLLRANNQTDFGYVELAKHVSKAKGAKKILFVLDYTPRESLRTGLLFNGPTADLFTAVINVAEKIYQAPYLSDSSWLACTYHCVKTQGASEAFKEEAHREFKRRLFHIIANYKPDVVVTFGPDPFNALNGDYVARYVGKTGVQFQHFYGVPIETSVTSESKTHKFQHVPTLSLHSVLNGSADGSAASCIGYLGRTLTTALNGGEMLWRIPKLDYEIEVVNTIEAFDKMYAEICKAKDVAIDTEATSLNKRVNKTLTWQFATSDKKAYILPFLHKDSAFLPEEIAYIRKKLRLYFECKNKNQYQLYANAAFDMNRARHDLSVRYFKSHVWDVMAGQFCFHPDTYVVTEDGRIKIRDLVRLPEDVRPRVLSYNHKTQDVDYKPILLATEHSTQEEMYELEYEGGTLRVTGNHEVWSVTRNAYTRVDQIFEGEEVLVLDGQ